MNGIGHVVGIKQPDEVSIFLSLRGGIIMIESELMCIGSIGLDTKIRVGPTRKLKNF